jgi:hypothetical protein
MVFAIDRRDLPLLQAVTMVTVIGFAWQTWWLICSTPG